MNEAEPMTKQELVTVTLKGTRGTRCLVGPPMSLCMFCSARREARPRGTHWSQQHLSPWTRPA